MSDNVQLQKMVEEFVDQLNEHFRAQVIATLSGKAPATVAVSNGKPGRKASNGNGHSNGHGNGKRTQEEIDTLAEKFFNFIEENPNSRVETVNKVLGTTTKELALPIKKLLDEKRIKSRGNRRATAYFPVEK